MEMSFRELMVTLTRGADVEAKREEFGSQEFVLLAMSQNDEKEKKVNWQGQ